METKEIITSSYILFWLFFDSSRVFEKLQNESWYMNPHKEWIDSFFMEEGQKVLEVGAGIGQLAKYVQERYHCNVTAVDSSENMIKRAHASKITMMNADATNLPFADESFDFVMSSSLMNIVSDSQKALAEMLRVSKQGALITFLVPSEKMNTVNARKYIQRNDMKGFSEGSLLFWVKRVRTFSRRELEEIVQVIGYNKSIQTRYFFDDMLVSFTLKK